MAEPWRTGKIIKIADAAPTTKRFWIQVPELEKFDFEPGQFVTLDLPIHEQKNKRWRSYSIASAPDGTNVFELVIVLLEGGLGTTYLFDDVQVEVGTELLLRGPVGKFTLPETLENDLFLICTGTGIAPFRSMIHHVITNNIPHKNIHIVFGCRTLSDALYLDELKQLQAEHPGFHYHPTFSREETVGDGMYKGYVHNVYEEILKNNPAPANFYLCGWKNMVDEAKQRITNLGYDKKAIHLELYG